MKLNPNNRASGRCAVAAIQGEPAGPKRLAHLLRLQNDDLSRYPLDAASPPPEVSEALKVYEAEAVRAKQKAAKVEEAEEAQKAAAIRDVDAVAKAMGAGKPAPKPSQQAKAAEAVAAAVLETEGAERLLEAAHDALAEAVQDSFPVWRAQLVQDAAAARAAAAEAQTKAAAAVATARNLYTAVSKLTAEVLARDPRLADAARAETRQGLPWYEATHGDRSALQSVTLPHGNTHLRFPLDEVAGALAAAVAEHSFAQGDWLPPSDPDHDALLSAPLDLAADWVVAAVRRDWGTTCAYCRLPKADTVVQDGSTLVLVHAECRAPNEKEKKRQDARAAMSRRGYDAQPGQRQHWERG